MAEYPALPLFTDAFIADTFHLNAQQTGAYFMLLMCAWRSSDCSIPNDDKLLCRFARMTPKEWASNREVILSFWSRNAEGNFVQKRLLDERSRANDKRDKAITAGKASALKRNKRHSTDVPTKPQHNVNHPLTSTTNKILTDLKPSVGSLRESGQSPRQKNMPEESLARDAEFETLWNSWRPFDMPKGSKAKARIAYDKARKKADVFAILDGAKAYTGMCHRKECRTKHLVSWLNAEGWLDDNEAHYAESRPKQTMPDGKPDYFGGLMDAAKRAAKNTQGL